MGCYNSIVINAPAEEVWDVLKNFHNLSWSKNVVSKVDIIGDKSADEIESSHFIHYDRSERARGYYLCAKNRNYEAHTE